jgi:hypothetical protein
MAQAGTDGGLVLTFVFKKTPEASLAAEHASGLAAGAKHIEVQVKGERKTAQHLEGDLSFVARKAQRRAKLLVACKAAFQLHVQMTPETLDTTTADLADYFAPSVDLRVNPAAGVPGPSVTGDFGEVMGVLGPIWEGFVNTKAQNVSFNPSARDDLMIVLAQSYSNHLVHQTHGTKIPGTESEFQVTHTISYDAQNKICAWVQVYDHAQIEAARGVAEEAAGAEDATEPAKNISAAEDDKPPDDDDAVREQRRVLPCLV